MDLPLIEFDYVFHIGSLDAVDKGSRGSSLEGHGLSVSTCPDEWERIAKLGGLPWWELSKEDASFVDAHSLSKAQRKAIADWGVQEGYVEQVTVWHAVRWDDEIEDEIWFVCATKEEAELEVDEDGAVRRRRDLKGTPKLDGLVGQEAGLNCFDLLLVAYIQETTDLDGVWWEDVTDGWYSAPRGVILPGKVEGWASAAVHGSQPELSGLQVPAESATVADTGERGFGL